MNNKMNSVKIGLSIMLIIVLGAILVACGSFGNNKEDTTTSSYTIQYTNEGGTHTLTVRDGAPYSIETIPEKDGYTFLGLYDAKVGGTQYVDETGASLSTFTDKKNLVLFAQYAPIQYKIVLDYQGASVTGSRQLSVEYGADLPELPKNLSLEHKVFCGWYTQPECEGTQVADQYSNIPLVSVLNGNNFDLSSEAITLYAGFSDQKHNVTFWADDKSQEMEVAYNTPINEVMPDFRKDGKAVYSWSKLQNDAELTALFTGKVTDDLVLYAAEWAPILEFDANGGKDVNAIIDKEGSGINLPTSQRTDYTFAGWYTKGGVEFTAKAMPAESQQLTAKWNAQLIFDTNGGTAVANISEPMGTAISLPTTEKDNYIFAGWYTADGTQYSTTSMPQDTVKLVAKYYKVLTVNKSVLPASKEGDCWYGSDGPNLDMMYGTVYTGGGLRSSDTDVSDIYNMGIHEVTITLHYKACISTASMSKPMNSHVVFYHEKTASDAYCVMSVSDTVTDDNYSSYEHTAKVQIKSTHLYCSWYSTENNGNYSDKGKWTDIWLEIEYPDMTTLY